MLDCYTSMWFTLVMYPQQRSPIPDTAYNVAGTAAGAWLYTGIGQAEAEWLVRQGIEPFEASKRAAIAGVQRWIWGMFWIGTILPLFAAFTLVGVAYTPKWIAEYWMGYRPTPSQLHAACLDGALHNQTDCDPYSLSMYVTDNHWFPYIGIASIIAAVVLMWGYFLIGAHIWRHESRGIGTIKKRWWRFYWRPLMKDMHVATTTNDKVLLIVMSILRWVLVYIPVSVILFVSVWGGFQLLSEQLHLSSY